MSKRSYYFNLSNGHLVKVSRLRFYFRKWFHFSISGFELVVLTHLPDLQDFDYCLCWLPVFTVPNLSCDD